MKINFFFILLLFTQLCKSQILSEEEYKRYTEILIKDTLPKSNEDIFQKPTITRGESYFNVLKFEIKHNPSEKFNGKYIIYCKESLWIKLNKSIEKYGNNVREKFNMDVLVYTIQNETPDNLKKSIIEEKDQLKGVVFIGDVEAAWFELSNDFDYKYTSKYVQFPCDLFYMDLDGEWLDINGNGLYDKHSGKIKPEIFVSRIHPYLYENTDVSNELVKYFTKNERYYATDHKDLAYKSFAFVDKDWQEFESHSNDIKYVHGKKNFENATPINKGVLFGGDLYYNTIKSPIGFLQFDCHSTETYHVLSTEEYISSEDILEKPINAVAVNLFCCSALNWKGKRYSDPLLGSSYLFGKNNVQCVIGSTKSGSMLNFDEFYKPLGVGKCMGDAYVEWWNNGISQIHTNYEISWHYGMAMFGDPMIQLGKQNFYKVNADELISINTENNTTCADGNSVIELEVNKMGKGELIWFDGTKSKTIEIKPYKTTDYKVYLFDDDGNGFLATKHIEIKKKFNGNFPKIFYVRKNQSIRIDARDYRYGNSNDTNFIYSWSSGDSGPVVEFTLKEDKPLELLVFGGCDTEIFNFKLVTLSNINYFFRKVIFRRRMVKYD